MNKTQRQSLNDMIEEEEVFQKNIQKQFHEEFLNNDLEKSFKNDGIEND